MKFSIQKNTLQKLLNEHNKVIPIRTTLPVLSCALFEIKKNMLLIRTTDLYQTIISSTTIKDESTGSIAIPMYKLNEIIQALPEGEIKINTNEDFLIEISNNQGSYKITGRDSQEFPEKTETTKESKLLLKGKELLEIINKTTYATSKDDLKPALTGVYFNIKENNLIAVATDGHKLVKFEKTLTNKTKTEQSIIIPAKFLNILKNIIERDQEIEIIVNENHLSTQHKEYVFICCKSFL